MSISALRMRSTSTIKTKERNQWTNIFPSGRTTSMYHRPERNLFQHNKAIKETKNKVIARTKGPFIVLK